MSSPNATPTSSSATQNGRGRRAELKNKIADSTLVQALLAGALSFTHIRDVALHHGQAGWKSWAYPLSVDLITVAAYRRLKADQAAGAKTGVAWSWFIIGLTASLGANVADAITTAPAGANPADLTTNVIIGMWPAAAFLGSTLLRHGDKPTSRQATVQPPAAGRLPVAPMADQPPVTPNVQPTSRPSAPIVQQRPAVQPTTAPPPIPVQPTGQPSTFAHLGPRADVGELPMPVWIEIGRPVYQELKKNPADRPTEKALQAALTQRVAALIAAGKLPPAVGEPSGSTAKRVRRAIEERHPELKNTVQPPRQLVAATH